MKKVVFSIIACSLAAAFIALGFWQLRRLSERRAANALLSARRIAPFIDLDSASDDTAHARFRRVRVAGTYDYSREFSLTLRGRNGSPGVNIITPLQRAGHDTLLLVNRGWIYAPDGITADRSHWREGGVANVAGFVETFSDPRVRATDTPARSHSYRWLDRAVLEKDLGKPIYPFYVVIAPDSDMGYASPSAGSSREKADSAPPRVEPAPLDEGPHKSYAIQWFSFAAISIIGLVIFLRRT